jgi:EmrB/QacA subfamily drug resistance transporter
MSVSPETIAAGGDQLDRAIVRIGFAVVLGSIMSVLDTTIVNVALNTLSIDLHTSLDSIQWVVTAYLLALAAVIPISGWATRRFGTKRLYIAAIILFTLGSALCGMAWSTASLVAFRVLQGIGGGLILPVGQTALARAAGPRRIGRAMSMVGIPTVLAPIIGPTVGGLLLEHLSWHWIFYVNIPVGIVAVVVSLRFLPTDRPEPGGRLDLTGLALLAVGLPAAIYGLAEIQSGHTVRWVASLLGGVALIVGFAWHARRVPEPLLDIRLYRKPTFVAASVATFCLGAAVFGGMILLPLYYQNVRGTDPVVTGLLLIPQGIGVAISMGITGRLVDRVGGGIVALGGVIITSLFTLPLVFIGAHTSYVWIGATLVGRGFGVGASMMPAMAAAFAVLRPDEIHDASPQLNVIQRVGGSMGTAILAVILSHNILDASAPSGGKPPTRAALARAFGNTFWWALGITAAAAVPAAFLMVSERQTRRRGGQTGQTPRFATDEDGIPVPLFGLGEG